MKELISKKQHILCLLAITALAGITAYYLFRNNELSVILREIGGINLIYLLPALLSMIVFFFIEAICIRILLKPIFGKTGLLQTTRYAYIDFYFSSITPGCCGGQPSQIYFMHRDGIPASASSLTLLCFNMCYHVAIIIIAVIIMITAGNMILTDMGGFIYLFLFGLMAKILLVSFYFIAIFNKKFATMLVTKAISILGRLHILRNPRQKMEKAETVMDDYRRGAEYIKDHPLTLAKIMLLVSCHVLLLYSIPFWVYNAFALEGITCWQIIANQAALTLSVESLPVPGGIGITEGGFMFVFSRIFGEGNVLAALLLCRAFTYYFGLLAGGCITCASLLAKKCKKLHEGD